MRVVFISRFLLRLERLSDIEYELSSRGNKRRKHREAASEECVSYSHTRACLHVGRGRGISAHFSPKKSSRKPLYLNGLKWC